MLEKAYDLDKCIHLNLVNRSDEEVQKIVEETQTTIYDAKDQFRWHEVNGKYYRFKFSNRLFNILNELIGPKIAKRLELQTVNNIPAIMDCSEYFKLYGILSENFKQKDHEYVDMFGLGFKHRTPPHYKNITKLQKYCREEDYPELIDALFKMTALDHIMGQADRVSGNFLFEKKGDKTTFAPLFDYSEAYEAIKDGCVFNLVHNRQKPFNVANALIAPAFYESKFRRRLKKYPNFQKYLEKVKEIDIIEILEEIEKENNLTLSDQCKYYYDVRTKEKQNIIIF
ncbi:MAG: hypothetical protein PHO63_00690 [Bacilli bacterium]|nr:hypothetical protein [Bacilli bacterium]MDD4809448.1 hypothetical protein [Bacilli bacterium]